MDHARLLGLHHALLPQTVSWDDPSRILAFDDNDILRTTNDLNTFRFTAFIQDLWKIDGDSLPHYMLNAGLRLHYWTFTPKEGTVSPRLAFIYNPRWEHDWIFSLRTGLYYQPAFYREMRRPDGTLNHDIKSQRSAQVVAGAEYNFKLWRRPFKFTAEAYYKYLDRLISYNVDNVRIIYSGENDAVGYAAGLDLKISGEFIKGLESWFSVSLMKTEEDLLNTCKIAFEGGWNSLKLYFMLGLPTETDEDVMAIAGVANFFMNEKVIFRNKKA